MFPDPKDSRHNGISAGNSTSYQKMTYVNVKRDPNGEPPISGTLYTHDILQFRYPSNLVHCTTPFSFKE